MVGQIVPMVVLRVPKTVPTDIIQARDKLGRPAFQDNKLMILNSLIETAGHSAGLCHLRDLQSTVTRHHLCSHRDLTQMQKIEVDQDKEEQST